MFPNIFDNDINIFEPDSTLVDFSQLSRWLFNDYIVHINIRSVRNKVNELELLLAMLKFPKLILLSETWLDANINLVNMQDYSFVSSPSRHGRGGSVGGYLNNSVQYFVMVKSCDRGDNQAFDFIVIELIEYKVEICCMYCPPGSKSVDIFNVVEQLKSRINLKFQFIVGGDLNVNLIKDDTDTAMEFINAENMLVLHPVISLPTRISNTCAFLIDNFVCDFSLLLADLSLLLARTNGITSDISDHFMIALKLPIIFVVLKHLL